MKGYDEVKEFIESELSDYSYFEVGELKIDQNYELGENEEYYEVEISSLKDTKKTLYFKYDRAQDIIAIELSEDNYEEVNGYDWRVKYLWMALLEWN